MKRRSVLLLPLALLVPFPVLIRRVRSQTVQPIAIRVPLLNDVFVGSPNTFQELLRDGKGVIETLTEMIASLPASRTHRDRSLLARQLFRIGDLYNFTEDKVAALR